MLSKFISFSNLTLLVALSLSSVAAYYSIIGLTAIFAGAVIPVIIMGSILEVGKITTTVWLRKYWNRASWVLKMYLVPAVIALALLTSMGIFGFLSKAHMDSGLVSGDVQAKLSLYDEKIKTQRDNIEVARKALSQMDAQVDARLGRSDSEQGAERAVQIRRQQAGERAKLQKEIADAQQEISKLNEERAPIAAENRKVEAEVGPIKYIAALIYGDNADMNTLEAAVRWVIILLVVVFDPLAIALVLAANASKEWDKEEPKYEEDDGPLTENQIEQIQETVEPIPSLHEINNLLKDATEIPEPIEPILEPEPIASKVFINPHPIGWMFNKIEHVKEKVKKPRKKKQKKTIPAEPATVVAEVVEAQPTVQEPVDSPERPGDYVSEPEIPTITRSEGGYVSYNGRHMAESVLRNLHPELFATADKEISNGFGSSFPLIAESGDLFVRTDAIPNKLFKYNGRRWIEINKEHTESYLANDEYIKFLIDKVASGEYDIDSLTHAEQDAIRSFMQK